MTEEETMPMTPLQLEVIEQVLMQRLGDQIH
jgi:hypothetical protein